MLVRAVFVGGMRWWFVGLTIVGYVFVQLPAADLVGEAREKEFGSVTFVIRRRGVYS